MSSPAILNPYETLKITLVEPHIVKVEMHRPEAANAFNTLMATEMVSFFEAFSLDISDCRVVILTGSGQKAFCAGGDLKERNGKFIMYMIDVITRFTKASYVPSKRKEVIVDKILELWLSIFGVAK